MILREENITGNVLKHMIHSEDLILTGREGCLLLLRTFRDIFNALKGNSPTSRITQKIDGAPAVIAASDFHGQKFVALKHSWDKGKIFQSVEEIKDNFSDRPDLCAKLEYLFNSLDSIQIPKDEIWHGDFLYHIDDIKIDEIDNKKYIVFRPNTIVYAIPIDDPLSETIMKSTIGVAWHTKYTGKSFDDIHISFDVSVSSVNEVPDVYQMDAKIPSLVGRVTMDSEETDRAEETLDSLDLMVNGITVDEGYEKLVSNEIIVLLLNTYRNYIIKESNRQFPDIQGLKEWIIARGEKEKEKKKTDKGKASVEAKTQGLISVIDKNNDLILRIYEAQEFATTLKEMFISKLNSLSSMKSFVSHISQGYIATSGEGFAVSDIDGNVYKLVSRLEFSRNNFSKEIIKGWQSEKRMNERRLPKKSALKLFKEELESEDAQEENQSTEDAEIKDNTNNKPVDPKVDIDFAQNEFVDKVNDNVNAEFKKYKKDSNTEVEGLTKKGRTPNEFNARIMPKEKGVTRDDLKKDVLNLDSSSDVDVTDTGLDGTTPIADIELDGPDGQPFYVHVEFKDNRFRGMTAEQTKGMEELWGSCICQGFWDINKSNTENTSFRELVTDEVLDIIGLNHDWKGTLLGGTQKIITEFSNNGNNLYYVFREGTCFSPPGYPDHSGSESIHNIIDNIVKDDRVFGKNTQKDTWNPSDLYLCEVNSYKEFIDKWTEMKNKSFTNEGAYLSANRSCVNALLREFLSERKVIGISLKKLDDVRNAHFTWYNAEGKWDKKFFEIIGNTIRIQRLGLFSEKEKSLGGITFDVKEKGVENGEYINYSFRRFSGKDTTVYLELEPKRSNARLGKTPIVLVRDEFKDEVGKDFPIDNAREISNCVENIKNLRPLVEQTLRLFGQKRIRVITSDGIDLSLRTWDDFVKRLEVLNTLGEDGISYGDRHRLLDWPKLISFLRALAGNTEDVLYKWYSGASKSGEFFAPYVKIS